MWHAVSACRIAVAKKRKFRMARGTSIRPDPTSSARESTVSVVVCRPAVEGALHLLAAKQPIELDVVRVIERSAGLFFFHLGLLRTRMPEPIQTVERGHRRENGALATESMFIAR